MKSNDELIATEIAKIYSHIHSTFGHSATNQQWDSFFIQELATLRVQTYRLVELVGHLMQKFKIGQNPEENAIDSIRSEECGEQPETKRELG